jgi:leucyl aminopeptidase
VPEPIRFEATTASAAEVEADLLVLPVFEGPKPGPGGAELGRALGADLVEVLRRNAIKGKAGDTLLVPGMGAAARMILFVGTGPEASAGVNEVRQASTRAGAKAGPYGVVASTLPQLGPSPEASARAFVEGFLLGAYRFDRYRNVPADERPRTRLVRALVAGRASAVARKGLQRGEVTGDATNWARDLVNTPAIDATPEALAEEARRMAAAAGLECRVWTKADLEKGGFGGVLGVGGGSAHGPRMVELAYAGGGRGRPIAITGKGVTFDSGGLNLKRRETEIGYMKSDMAGAAAAFATMRAVAAMQLRANVIAAVPLAENMPGGAATHPGDVLRHRGGRTSEVLDTDAEGRVLLADVLAYLSEKDPAVILDSATLTDAAGLGGDVWAVMSTDRALAGELLEAGAEAGEPGWELPLWTPYRKLIDSALADVKNVGDHGIDSSIMAGLFLRDFVGDTPWLHLDTGSSAWAEHETDLWPEGATGSPTRAFVRFIERRAARSRA